MSERQSEESAITTQERGFSEDIPALIEQVHDGRLDPATLSPEQRRRCVENLSNREFSNGDIAALMRTSERTVRRDRAALRAEAAVAPDTTLGDQLLGEFERHVDRAIARLNRVSRDEASPPYARMWAAEAVVRVYKQYLEAAQRLGYIEDGRRRLDRQRRQEEIANGNPRAASVARLLGEL